MSGLRGLSIYPLVADGGAASPGPLYVFVQKMILAAAFGTISTASLRSARNPVTLIAIVSSPSRPIWVIAEPR